MTSADSIAAHRRARGIPGPTRPALFEKDFENTAYMVTIGLNFHF